MATKESNIINYALAALGLYLVFRKQPLLQTTPSSGGSGNNIFTPVKEVVVTPDAPVKEIKTPATPITDLIIAKPVKEIKTQVEPVETIKTPVTPITDLIIAKPVKVIEIPETPITDLIIAQPVKEVIAIKTQVEPAVIKYKYQDPNYNRYDDDIDIPVKEVIAIKTQVEPAVEEIYVPPFDKPIYEIPKIDIIFPKYEEPEGELTTPYVPIFEKPKREIPYIDFIFPKYEEPEGELTTPYVPIFEEPIYTTDIDIVQPTPETNAPIYSGGTSGANAAPESNYIQEYTGGYGSGSRNFWDSLYLTQWTDNIADPTTFDTASAFNADQA